MKDKKTVQLTSSIRAEIKWEFDEGAGYWYPENYGSYVRREEDYCIDRVNGWLLGQQAEEFSVRVPDSMRDDESQIDKWVDSILEWSHLDHGDHDMGTIWDHDGYENGTIIVYPECRWILSYDAPTNYGWNQDRYFHFGDYESVYSTPAEAIRDYKEIVDLEDGAIWAQGCTVNVFVSGIEAGFASCWGFIFPAWEPHAAETEQELLAEALSDAKSKIALLRGGAAHLERFAFDGQAHDEPDGTQFPDLHRPEWESALC